jgi:Mn-containing catalase
MQPNFRQGKLPGLPALVSVYYNLSEGEGEQRGS